MALFGRKKKEEVVEEVKIEKVTAQKVVTKKVSTKTTNSLEAAPVVKTDSKKEETTSVKNKFSYRITEKATKLSDKNVYVLNIPKDLNKTELKKELQTKYKVTVLGINIVNTAKKPKFYKGRPGVKGGGKKAYITLKAGESIVL